MPAFALTYQDMAEFYGTAVVPTRVRHPRDKAKVETGVQVVERWVMAPLPEPDLFESRGAERRAGRSAGGAESPADAALGKSRWELFETLDQPALREHPDRRYEPAEWKRAKVGIDYHVPCHRHYYSVPYELRHEEVELRVTEHTVEVFSRGERIASHLRDDTPGYHTTRPEHMPAAHRAYLDWTPERFLRWAEKTDPATAEMVRTLLVGRAPAGSSLPGGRRRRGSGAWAAPGLGSRPGPVSCRRPMDPGMKTERRFAPISGQIKPESVASFARIRKRAFRDHTANLLVVKGWPSFDEYRADPRYKDLLKRLNLD